MPLYFAYGSNMLPEQMRRRCPGAQNAGRGILHHWKYISTKRGTANIIPVKGHEVHGVLWRCTLGHIANLDRYEGISRKNYLRHFTPIITPDNKLQTAAIYVSRHRIYPGNARCDYMLSAVLPGAEICGLPSIYIRELLSWLPRNRIGAAGRQYYGRRA